MTPTNEAKKVVRDFLNEKGLPFTKLTARTVSFAGFGYGSSIFVKIHGWNPSPLLDELKARAKEYRFCVETDGMFG